MLCEVKTVFSSGYLAERDANISMQDERLFDTGVFQNKIDFRKINDCLADAVRKRSTLAADCPEFKELPLLVAFFFDFFADFLPFYPRSFDKRFHEISGILTIEHDLARIRAFEHLTDEEQEHRLRNDIGAGLPPNTIDFVLVRNKAALRVVPKDFQLKCVTEAYDASL